MIKWKTEDRKQKNTIFFLSLEKEIFNEMFFCSKIGNKSYCRGKVKRFWSDFHLPGNNSSVKTLDFVWISNWKKFVKFGTKHFTSLKIPYFNINIKKTNSVSWWNSIWFLKRWLINIMAIFNNACKFSKLIINLTFKKQMSGLFVISLDSFNLSISWIFYVLIFYLRYFISRNKWFQSFPSLAGKGS